jgi:hypothetical protein
MKEPLGPLVDVDTAAAMLRVTPVELHTWHAQRTGPMVVRAGSERLYRTAELCEWVSRLGRGA